MLIENTDSCDGPLIYIYIYIHIFTFGSLFIRKLRHFDHGSLHIRKDLDLDLDHYDEVIMGAIASQITSLTIV